MHATRSVTLYECPECLRYADPGVVQDNACYLAGHGRPVKVTMHICGVCGGRDLGVTDGPRGEAMPRVCGACTDVEEGAR